MSENNLLDRELYRKIKNMDKNTLNTFIQNIYNTAVACRAKCKKMTSKTQKSRSKIPLIGIKEWGFHVKGVFKYIFQP